MTERQITLIVSDDTLQFLNTLVSVAGLCGSITASTQFVMKLVRLLKEGEKAWTVEVNKEAE